MVNVKKACCFLKFWSIFLQPINYQNFFPFQLTRIRATSNHLA